MSYPLLHPDDHEPEINDVTELRAHRKTRLALGYRIFGALRWGALGDGHISARDPERPDHFWLARYGAPFHSVTVGDLGRGPRCGHRRVHPNATRRRCDTPARAGSCGVHEVPSRR